ncbi:MAG: UPF0149 family protein [Gammaproteobacteria bacterium]|nr:UPF0149 family protein [Gammaproteobacteria bacterium]MBQ0839178.1 UPF0149 family protein [Gammaproteobacteria bacterium]
MDFEHYCRAFSVAGLTTNPAELQAVLCGRLSGGQRLADTKVLEVAADLLDASASSMAAIRGDVLGLYKKTAEQLEDGSGVFELLLPDDDDSLHERIETLSQWCQNYLSGLGQSGLSGDAPLAADVSEAMRDLAAIAMADSGNSDDELDPYASSIDEQDEASFFELVEYVRVAVTLIYAEIKDMSKPKGKTLH